MRISTEQANLSMPQEQQRLSGTSGAHLIRLRGGEHLSIHPSITQSVTRSLSGHMSQSRHAVLQLNTALQQQHAASLLQQHLKTRFFVLQREFSKSLGPQRDIDVNFL